MLPPRTLRHIDKNNVTILTSIKSGIIFFRTFYKITRQSVDYGSTIRCLITSLLLKSLFGHFWEVARPKNITYLWGFGSFLGVVMVIQVISGVFLAFYYVRGALAWDSVIEITREVRHGWILRLLHRNMASFVFVVLYIHFFRGLIQSSFLVPFVWIRGWLIIFLTIRAAFLGYVLPWGQISLWGATVIINLIRVLPFGKSIVIWLWGGFYVSNLTCTFFFALHFLVPFLILVLAGVHLLLLHFTGRSAPRGLSSSPLLKIKFGHIFLYKDVVNLSLLWGFWLWGLALPDWAADPVNFAVSDLSNSPLHIQPEWYFLHLYAVLRSIPNKLGGLLGFILALVGLGIIGFLYSDIKLNHLSSYKLVAWRFFSTNLLLIWLGSQPVEEPYTFMGQILTRVFFIYFILTYLLTRLSSTT